MYSTDSYEVRVTKDSHRRGYHAAARCETCPLCPLPSYGGSAMVRPADGDFHDDLPSYSGAGHNEYPPEYDQEGEPIVTQNLAECRVCHLLISVSLDGLYTTVCDYCQQILIKRAETQERLDRNNERHHTR